MAAMCGAIPEGLRCKTYHLLVLMIALERERLSMRAWRGSYGQTRSSGPRLGEKM